ncbi:hypothetical protein E4U57_006285 [Claviceps arundinis]|uniref:Uncharacterized protein n=1 Tax=Claviceps arundinis TaxID=1623583 RepID=A0ABQ7P272_9HYPO|nr:hypothetical protein E4U57_006285 [Claviceps arundinis]
MARFNESLGCATCAPAKQLGTPLSLAPRTPTRRRPVDATNFTSHDSRVTRASSDTDTTQSDNNTSK